MLDNFPIKGVFTESEKNMLKHYEVVFYGRENEAIGRCYKLPTVEVFASNIDDARNKGFDKLTGKYEINACCHCKEKQPMKEFDVYYLGTLYDTVFFNADIADEDVKNSLVNHDNYPPEIQVVGK